MTQSTRSPRNLTPGQSTATLRLGSPTLSPHWPTCFPDLGMGLSLGKLDFEVKSLWGWLLLTLHRCFLLVCQFPIHILGAEMESEAQLGHEGALG